MTPTGKRTGWLVAGVVTAIVVGLIGISNPATALRALVILSVLVASYLLISAIRALFERVPPIADSVVSATVDPRAQTPDADLPWHYTGLIPSATANPTLSPGARAALRTIATERLWDRHHLNVWHEPHEPAISGVVSDHLWAVINPHQRTPPPPHILRHDLLGRHLDELDAL